MKDIDFQAAIEGTRRLAEYDRGVREEQEKIEELNAAAEAFAEEVAHDTLLFVHTKRSFIAGVQWARENAKN